MVKGFVVYPTYEIVDDKAYVKLYGRLENGESFVTVNEFKPYFYIKKSDVTLAKKVVDIDFEETDLKDFSGQQVSRVTLTIPKDVPKLKNILLDNNIISYEADIRFAYRYLIDKNIRGGLKINGKYEKPESEHVDRLYREPKIESSDFYPNLNVLSIDIETDMKAQVIYCISMYSDGTKESIIVSGEEVSGATSVKSERELLECFSKRLKELDPDIITGWNVIDFDLMVLKRKYKEHDLPFSLGRNDWTCRIDISESFFLTSKARFPGRVVLDGIDFMKTSFISLEDYKLNTAAKTLLGDEKLIDSDDRGEEITRLYNEDKESLIRYNLQDAKLVLDILRKTKVIDLTILRTKLTGMQLDRVNASIASFDILYLKELQKRKIVAPTAKPNEYGERIKGGFVKDSIPGFYDNIMVFDFKSLYPSVIRTFNIDPVNYVEYKDINKYKRGELIRSPNGAHFKNNQGILPMLLQRLWEERDQAKKENNKISANAIKITMNSMFGVLANPTCRFYNKDVANAITHFGQYLIKLTAEKVTELGYLIIYGDTDSIFVHKKNMKDEDCEKNGKDIENYINSFYDAYVKKNYNRKSFLQLEFEKIYRKFFMPTIRGSSTGAKKRYAGIRDKSDEIEFVGLEFVRSDWSDVAKKIQYELLKKVFNGEKVSEFLKDFVKDLEDGKMDSLLVYKKWIRKPVSEYTKTTPPHIQAARKIGMKKTGLIRYVLTIDGPEAEGHVKHKIDYTHYIEKQIKPVADSILAQLKKNFDEIIKGKQKSLFDY